MAQKETDWRLDSGSSWSKINSRNRDQGPLFPYQVLVEHALRPMDCGVVGGKRCSVEDVEWRQAPAKSGVHNSYPSFILYFVRSPMVVARVFEISWSEMPGPIKQLEVA